MTIEFLCGKCGKELTAPDSKAGKSGECPRCGQAIIVPASQSDTSSKLPLEVDSSVETSPTCPMCGAQFLAGADTCHVCGESLQTPERVRDVNERFSKGHRIRIGQILRAAWDRFTGQMGMAVADALVYLFSAGVLVLLIGLFWNSSESLARSSLPEILIGAVCYLGFYVAQIWLALGLCRFSLAIARGKKAELSQVFAGGRYLLRAVLCSLLIGMQLIALWFGLLFLLGVPIVLILHSSPWILLGIVGFLEFLVILAYCWTPYVLVDIDSRGVYVVLHSFDLMKRNYRSVLLVCLSSLLILSAGCLLFGGGLIVAFPFVMVVFAVTYDHLSGGKAELDHDNV